MSVLQKVSLEQFEEKFYCILGVRYFRKAVLALEKILHRKDNGYNVNYHIATLSLEDVSGFVKFFFYNGAIHVRNIIMLSLYLLVFKAVLQRAFAWYDYVLIVLGIKDIYCVMLQRYNFLRLNARFKTMSQRRQVRIDRRISQLQDNLQQYNPDNKDTDLELIHRIRQALLDGTDATITSEDIGALQRFCELLSKKNT